MIALERKGARFHLLLAVVALAAAIVALVG
jgi:hypothetical protein